MPGIIPKSTASWKLSVIWSDWWKWHCIKWIFWESEKFFTYKTCYKKCHLMYYEENDTQRRWFVFPAKWNVQAYCIWYDSWNFLYWTKYHVIWVCVCVCAQSDLIPHSFLHLFLSLHEFPVIIISVLSKCIFFSGKSSVFFSYLALSTVLNFTLQMMKNRIV